MLKLTLYSYVVSNSKNLHMLKAIENITKPAIEKLPAQCEGVKSGWQTDMYRSMATAKVEYIEPTGKVSLECKVKNILNICCLYYVLIF